MDSINAKATLKSQVLSPYIEVMKKTTEKVLDYMYGEKVVVSNTGSKKRNHNPIRDGTYDTIDIWFFFWVNWKNALDVDRDSSRKARSIERKKAIDALVKSVRTVDNHYTDIDNTHPNNNIAE